MDKAGAKRVMDEINAAVAPIVTAHNLKVSGMRGSFDVGLLKVNLTFTSTDPATDPRRVDWERYADSYGLPADALDKVIAYNGEPFTITGLQVSRRKFPVAAKRVRDGKELLLTVVGVKKALGLKVEAWEVWTTSPLTLTAALSQGSSERQIGTHQLEVNVTTISGKDGGVRQVITYDVPAIDEGAIPFLPRYGDHDGDELLRIVIAGDQAGLDDFLKIVIDNINDNFRLKQRRADTVEAMIAVVNDSILPTVTLTGFKATMEGKGWRAKRTVAEGEGCEQTYCDLAGKFRLPPAPEGLTYRDQTLVCQKHAIDAIVGRAEFATRNEGERVFLISTQEKVVTTAIREGLAKIK